MTREEFCELRRGSVVTCADGSLGLVTHTAKGIDGLSVHVVWERGSSDWYSSEHNDAAMFERWAP